MSERGETFDAVQAALLDSSGRPNDEILSALRAVVEFAVLECGATSETLHAALVHVIEQVEQDVEDS